MASSPNRFIQALGAPTRLARTGAAKARWGLWSLCWLIFIVLVAWDVWLALDAVASNTWSEQMRIASGGKPVLPWLFGVILGHLFHPADGLAPVMEKDAALTILSMATVVAFVVGAFGLLSLSETLVALTMLCGVAAGVLLWPKPRATSEWRW
jgi:hypothetical protein